MEYLKIIQEYYFPSNQAWELCIGNQTINIMKNKFKTTGINAPLAMILLLSIFYSCRKEGTELLSNVNKDQINNPVQEPTTVTDIDGNVYDIVKIGSQKWMKQNLKTSRYANGDPIPKLTASPQWYYATTGAYCNQENNPSISSQLGNLYNAYALIDERNLCPTGWRVPDTSDWNTLINNQGGSQLAGEALKEEGNAHWSAPNLATNGSGFTAISGGGRIASSVCYIWLGYTNQGVYWTKTDYSSTKNYSYILYNFSKVVNISTYDKNDGFPVRCVKD